MNKYGQKVQICNIYEHLIKPSLKGRKIKKTVFLKTYQVKLVEKFPNF